MLDGLAALEREPASARQPSRAVARTTLVTNAVIERKGARTALLCTAGFRDVLEMRRDMRSRPTTFCSIRRRRWCRARCACRSASASAPTASVEAPPVDPREIAAVADAAASGGVESVAVCFLHAYRNPAHEQAVARRLARAPARIAVSLSSRRLAARSTSTSAPSTTVANAYVQPLIEPLSRALERRCAEAGFAAPLCIMLSSGGITTSRRAARVPVRLVESGPAGGALVAPHFARAGHRPSVLSFDMGGTTAKACLIDDGEPLLHRRVRGRARAALQARAAACRCRSRRRPDRDRRRRRQHRAVDAARPVAGRARERRRRSRARPAMARGGTQPTVTDADLCLGYLDPELFARRLDALDAAPAAAASSAARPNRSASPVAAAWRIHDVVNETMAAAVRMHVNRARRRPVAAGVVAFGGAGPGPCRASRGQARHSASDGAAGRRRPVGAVRPCFSRRRSI